MPKSRAADKTDQQNSDSEDETFHDLLNLRDQNKVIHEYKLKKPQPTIEQLATKYKVSTKHISYILKNQQAILKSEKGNDVEETVEESARLLLRSAQIKFLDMVMYEYLQRALYYSINIDEEMFKNKTEEVVDCMALMYFKDQSSFVDNFKSLYGLREISTQSLLEDIELKDEKPESFDPVDMVRYVQRHKSQYTAAQAKKDKSNAAELKVYRNETSNASSRSQKSNSPSVFYEPSEEDGHHDWEDNNDSGDDTNDFEDRRATKVMKIEVSPTRLTEETLPQPKSPTIKGKTKSIPKPMSDDRMKILQNTNDMPVIKPKRSISVASSEEEFQTLHKPDESGADNKETLSSIKTEREDNLSIKIEVLSTDYEHMETFEIREPPSSSEHAMDIKSETLPGIPESHCPAEEFLPAVPEIHCPPQEFLPASPGAHCAPDEILNGPSDNPRKRPPSTVPLREIDTLDEALRSLRALENYALLKENLRAIGLLTQLEDALKKPPRQ